MSFRRRVATLYRSAVIAYVLFPLAVAYARDRKRFVLFGREREVSDEEHLRRARLLLRKFLYLGPTFIKLGQVMSTRPDALPREYTETLSELQDEVPPDDWEEVREVIEEDVGSVDGAFERFNTTPISGASIGQVYVAQHEGRKVAVKVLRPGVEERVETDLEVMRLFLPVVLYFAKEGQRFTFENLASQFEKAIINEMDYGREAEMIRRIRSNFDGNPDVVIPRVVDELSGDKVITMEYIEGIKIDDVETLEMRGIDTSELVKRIQQSYIQMILEDGIFHADPHPGNLAVKDDGRLVFYDFGIVGEISEEMRRRIFEFYVAVKREDVDNMINTFIDMGALDPEVDREPMRRMFSLMVEDMKGKDIDDQRVEELVEDIQDDMYEFPIRIPRELALLFRTTTVLEGVCYTLDEDFDYTAIIADYVARKRLGPVMEVFDRVRETVETVTSVGSSVSSLTLSIFE